MRPRWSFIAAARGGCKNKSWVWDGLRGQLAPIHSKGGRGVKGKKVKCEPGHETSSSAHFWHSSTLFIHWKLIPRRYGRTYAFLHHRVVRWGTGSHLHKYLVCADTLDGPWRNKYERNLAHRRGAATFLQVDTSFVEGLKNPRQLGYHRKSCGASV